MFFSTFSYLKFLLKSQNQHGLHSPFVYDFVTKGLYKKTVKTGNFKEQQVFESLSKKQFKILFKIVQYFKIDSINFEFDDFKSKNSKKYKLLYISDVNSLRTIDFNALNSNHIIVAKNIYNSKKNYKQWQNIQKNKKATVTIDLFYFGLIFFRKEQAKEHFIIRS